jgi:hypothetical protein
MVLGDLIEAADELDNPDFYLDAAGAPTRDSEQAVLAVRVVKTDVLDPGYLYYALGYLELQGLWKEHELSASALLEVPLQPR